MSKKSVIFATIVIFILGTISSVFLFSLVNLYADLFRDLGVEELPFVTGFVINTSPLTPVLVFLLHSFIAAIIFFFGEKISKKNLNIFKVVIFTILVLLTLLVVSLGFILQNSVFQLV